MWLWTHILKKSQRLTSTIEVSAFNDENMKLNIPMVQQTTTATFKRQVLLILTLQGQYLFRCRKAEQLGSEIQKRIDAKYEMNKMSSNQKRYNNYGNSGSGQRCKINRLFSFKMLSLAKIYVFLRVMLMLCVGSSYPVKEHKPSQRSTGMR